MKSKIKLVKIDWIDSRSPTNRWEHLSELEANICHCSSVGYLIKDTDELKVIAANLADIDDTESLQASAVKAIPSCCVTRIVDLIERT